MGPDSKLEMYFLPTKSGRESHGLKNSLNNVFDDFKVPESYV